MHSFDASMFSTLFQTDMELKTDPKQDELARFDYKQPDSNDVFTVFYPPAKKVKQTADGQSDIEVLTTPNQAVVAIAQGKSQYAFVRSYLELLVTTTSVKQAKTRMILRAMLTQALLSFDSAKESKVTAEEKRRSFRDRSLATNANTKQEHVNPNQQLLFIITQLLIKCYAAGYDILADTSLCQDPPLLKAKPSKKRLEYKSFLDLAYARGFIGAIEAFYQFGHRPLDEGRLIAHVQASGAVVTSDLMYLALYYQDVSSAIQTAFMSMIHDPKIKYFSATATDPDALADRRRITHALFLYGSDYVLGRFNGSKKRIEALFRKSFKITTFGITVADDSGVSILHPGQSPDEHIFKELMRNYIKGNKAAKATVEKYRTCRTAELTAPRQIIKHIASQPFAVDTPNFTEFQYAELVTQATPIIEESGQFVEVNLFQHGIVTRGVNNPAVELCDNKQETSDDLATLQMQQAQEALDLSCAKIHAALMIAQKLHEQAAQTIDIMQNIDPHKQNELLVKLTNLTGEFTDEHENKSAYEVLNIQRRQKASPNSQGSADSIHTTVTAEVLSAADRSKMKPGDSFISLTQAAQLFGPFAQNKTAALNTPGNNAPPTTESLAILMKAMPFATKLQKSWLPQCNVPGLNSNTNNPVAAASTTASERSDFSYDSR